jgi:acyl-CoA dehydrogenase
MGSDIVEARERSEQVERFVREVVAPYEQDPRRDGQHGPLPALIDELRDQARSAGVFTPHIRLDGTHLSHAGTALVLRAAGLSPLGPLALNVAAPDEGNMFLLDKVGTPLQRERFLEPLIAGRLRSAFLMTEPHEDGGAGSDPSMLKTSARAEGDGWVISGRKAFATGFDGAGMAIIMARTGEGATMFLVALPNPALRIERVPRTIDSSMPGGHAIVAIEELRVGSEDILGRIGEGFANAQLRLAPARLTHCMRWLGAATRAQEIATAYACRRTAFGKALIDHEGVGFMLADNMIDLQQAELMIAWCASLLDAGQPGSLESSMTKVAVSESLFRVADRCVQAMGGSGVTQDTIVEQVFREIRAFRIYDGPTEVHKWSLAKRIKRDFAAATQ